jgi:GntR family transcriptional repressor for pyruvate dehydrogenase complex
VEELVFDKIRHGRISDNIVAQIKNAIFTGIYRPGDKLPSEKELISLFNVSRVPLREALRSLQEMGLITIRPGIGGGAFVNQMGIKPVSDSLFNMLRLGNINIGEIWEFRISIEPNIAFLASERRDQWDIKQIEEINSIREKAIQGRKAPVISNIDFHQAVAKASKNSLLIMVIDAIALILMEELKRFQFSLNDHRNIFKFHKEITESIKRKDSEKAKALMHEHLMDVKKRLKI